MLPAGVPGGAADYGAVLRERLPLAAPGVEVDIVEIGPDTPVAAVLRPGDRVFLQYSGYGYSARGAPLWLPRWARQARRQGCRVITFFHELYAAGRPWQPAFWLAPLQRWVAVALARESDAWLSNLSASAAWLRTQAPGCPGAALCVPSTIGEVAHPRPDRARHIAVFGSPALRLDAYRSAGVALFDWARRGGLQVHDIGSAIDDDEWAASARQHGVVRHGRLDAPEVSLRLGQASHGLICYPSFCIGKSSVFAAYAAHGVAPVVLSPSYPGADGLCAGRHFIDGLHDPGIDEPQAVSRALHAWYCDHDVAAHCQTLLKLDDTLD